MVRLPGRAAGIGDRLKHRPTELSGGQQQRVACARALITRPDLIFADEPTGNLDSNASGRDARLPRKSVNELGQSIVMVTHDPRSAAYADRVVFLADGKFVGELDNPTADSRARAHDAPWAADMRNVTIKGLLAHKLRLALTSLAIILGVTFISGSSCSPTPCTACSTGCSATSTPKIDFQVRGVAQSRHERGRTRSATRSRQSAARRRCARVPGVEAAYGTVEGYAQFVAPDGKAITNGGAPTLGIDYDPDPQISALRIIAGRPARAPATTS